MFGLGIDRAEFLQQFCFLAVVEWGAFSGKNPAAKEEVRKSGFALGRDARAYVPCMFGGGFVLSTDGGRVSKRWVEWDRSVAHGKYASFEILHGGWVWVDAVRSTGLGAHTGVGCCR